jgi:asparagine synthase (glutamine-hydrolysing)
MCRIYGYLSRRPFALAEKMKQVERMQLHGGPDDQNSISTPQYGIGANRLAITDARGGRQPYNSIHGIYAVLNGEIYNHNELREELEKDGYMFHDKCDGTIIPALYQKYGLSFVEYLDGMFTIAVLDLRQTQPELMVFSDNLAIKPVYYCYNPQHQAVAFSTEIPALLQFDLVSNDIWIEGIDHYLTTRAISGDRTLFKNIFCLAPKSILITKLGLEPKVHEYVSRIRYDGICPKSTEEASSILKVLLSEEVKKLSKADIPVCSVNSGGLDSSLLTSLLHTASPHQTHSFHVSCAGNLPFDERHYARELAEFYNLQHHETLVSPHDIPTLIPKMVFHLGQPNCAPHALSTYKLFECVSQNGFKVAITGEGSDELFCGHDRMIKAITSNDENWASTYLDEMSPCNEVLRQSLYTEEYKHQMDISGLPAKSQMLEKLTYGIKSRSENIRNFEQSISLASYILHRVEPLAMASAVEVRVPFCQPKIVDFSYKIDSAFLLTNGNRGKSVVYGAAEKLVPNSILERKKQPFTLPIISLMQKDTPLMNYVQDMLFSKHFLESNVFDKNSIKNLIVRQENSPSKETAFTLWALLTYSVWVEMVNSKFHSLSNLEANRHISLKLNTNHEPSKIYKAV